MKTIDGKPLADVFETYTKKHMKRVLRNSTHFEHCYRAAANMVFSGTPKEAVIDSLAPRGCDPTQSNGVVAGANQATRLLSFCD